MKPDALVYIIDDDAQVRNSLANLCRSVGIQAITFASADEFSRAERPIVPSCIILDVRFPGPTPSGLDFQRNLDIRTSPPIIFITGHGDIEMSVEAMKLGALEFLTKPVREQKLLDAIRRGLELDRRRIDDALRLAVLRERFNALSLREREIMHFVAQGQLNKQIAAVIGLSEVTVKAHRGRIMHKMRAHSLAELVRMSDLLSEAGTSALPAAGEDARQAPSAQRKPGPKGPTD